MIHRFCRPFTEVSSTSENAGAKNVECEFCAALRRARELEVFDPLPQLCSPLTPGVQLANLSYDGQMLRAELGIQWKRMFEQLPLIGEALVMTRNQAAILGRTMTFPELAFTAHGYKGASERGGLWFDFRTLGDARAVHLRSPSGHIFGIDFADEAGRLVHRFTATPWSNLDAFFGWVRLHQACSEHGRARPASNADDRAAGGHGTDQPGGPSALLSIMAACCEHRLRLRATVRTNAVIQCAQFIPQQLRSIADWWFAYDDTVGLHFCPLEISHTKSATHLEEDGSRLVLYCQTDSQRPSLVLESDDERQAATWCDLLHSVV